MVITFTDGVLSGASTFFFGACSSHQPGNVAKCLLYFEIRRSDRARHPPWHYPHLSSRRCRRYARRNRTSYLLHRGVGSLRKKRYDGANALFYSRFFKVKALLGRDFFLANKCVYKCKAGFFVLRVKVEFEAA